MRRGGLLTQTGVQQCPSHTRSYYPAGTVGPTRGVGYSPLRNRKHIFKTYSKKKKERKKERKERKAYSCIAQE